MKAATKHNTRFKLRLSPRSQDRFSVLERRPDRASGSPGWTWKPVATHLDLDEACRLLRPVDAVLPRPAGGGNKG